MYVCVCLCVWEACFKECDDDTFWWGYTRICQEQ